MFQVSHCSSPKQPFVRWLETVKLLKCKFTAASTSDCAWRRLQVHEQQAERQRKNILQKVLTFHARAHELQCKESLLKHHLMFDNKCSN